MPCPFPCGAPSWGVPSLGCELEGSVSQADIGDGSDVRAVACTDKDKASRMRAIKIRWQDTSRKQLLPIGHIYIYIYRERKQGNRKLDIIDPKKLPILYLVRYGLLYIK